MYRGPVHSRRTRPPTTPLSRCRGPRASLRTRRIVATFDRTNTRALSRRRPHFRYVRGPIGVSGDRLRCARGALATSLLTRSCSSHTSCRGPLSRVRRWGRSLRTLRRGCSARAWRIAAPSSSESVLRPAVSIVAEYWSSLSDDVIALCARDHRLVAGTVLRYPSAVISNNADPFVAGEPFPNGRTVRMGEASEGFPDGQE